MNVAALLIKKIDSFSFSKNRVQKKSTVVIWLFVLLTLVLLNAAVNFLKPSFCSKYLPFLAIGCLALAARFKISGVIASVFALSICLFFFFPALSYEERLWQLCIYFSVALNNFIFFLSLEEMELCWENLQTDADTSKEQALQIALKLDVAKKSSEEIASELKEELEKLKAEAEHRRIEKLQDMKKFELIQSEIEMLTLQKQEFVDAASEAKLHAANALCALKEQSQEFEKIQCQLKESMIAHQEALLLLQHQTTTLPHVEALEEDPQTLKRSLRHVEGLYFQLRAQFEEKAQLLSQTRKELFHIQTKCAILENESAEALIAAPSKEVRFLEKEIATLNQEVERLEIEISYLEELISHILSQ